MRRYVDKTGGLEIEKKESTVQKTKRRIEPSIPNKIEAVDVIDTAISYQVPSVGTNSNENGGSECKICGIKTSYDNRYFCVECWKKYKDEMIEGIKQSLEDVEIQIS